MEDAIPDESGWIEGIKRGDDAAFEAMFSAYGIRLCAFAFRWTRSRAAAEEIVQEVFLNIWMNHEKFEPAGTVKTYLFRAVKNRVVNYERHRRIEEKYEEVIGLSDELQESPAVDVQVGDKEMRVAVVNAIETIPDRAREIFLLNREQGLSYTEIAGLLGITVKTVEYHMARSFAHLRAALAVWAG